MTEPPEGLRHPQKRETRMQLTDAAIRLAVAHGLRDCASSTSRRRPTSLRARSTTTSPARGSDRRGASDQIVVVRATLLERPKASPCGHPSDMRSPRLPPEQPDRSWMARAVVVRSGAEPRRRACEGPTDRRAVASRISSRNARAPTHVGGLSAPRGRRRDAIALHSAVDRGSKRRETELLARSRRAFRARRLAGMVRRRRAIACSYRRERLVMRIGAPFPATETYLSPPTSANASATRPCSLSFLGVRAIDRRPSEARSSRTRARGADSPATRASFARAFC